MFKDNKAFTTPQIVIFILALAVVVGGYFAFGTKTQTPVPTPQVQAPTSTVAEIDTSGWQQYTNQGLGFIISYPNVYHVYLGHNLINYDENKYERGNPNGVKIQIQRYIVEDSGFDLSISEGVNGFIGKLNLDYDNSKGSKDSNETKIMDISPIGVLGFKNQVLAGPGGEFDVFYAFKDRNTYYGLLVWGRGNDQKIVEQILSTFKFANQ